MGMIAVFWSPFPGQAGTTTSLLAAASCMGLEFSSRMLLLGLLREEDEAVQRAFYTPEKNPSPLPDTGMDALLRLLQNRKLEASMLRDYAQSLLRERLDVLPGSEKPSAGFAGLAERWLEPLLDTARRAYDLVLIDGGSGNAPGWREELRNRADLLIVCLPQNRLLLERFFQSPESAWLSARKTMFVFGQFDSASSLTINNLQRRFRWQQSAFPVMHNTGWLDAVQHGEAIPYWFRNRKTMRQHENYRFVRQVRALAHALIEGTGMNQPLFSGKEDKP
ncbi:hypothetical protein B1748_34350 [Paenibacillus sp. MY03]|uniref:hypothetical protein n=1 Tax=Paenibacillus sp. MY03 TaxID=302980 RepID=UPI000B3C0668|nr:hypothetical protein [Paenibacillus sp. MY03]OUS68258.1 hypothetical protein B1748_34350 [Paenibacillus sp. MY03]